MKRFTKIMAIIMATALIMSIAAISASAATNYTDLTVSSSTQNHLTTLKKYLVVDENATIPNKTFNFSVAAGSAIAATNNTVAVIPGPVVTNAQSAVTAPTITQTTAFAPTDTTFTSAQSGDTSVTLSSGQKYAKQNVVVDLDGVTFDEPGVYRYVLTEDAQTSPYSNTGSNPLYLDVYVVNNTGTTLKIDGYVLHSDANAPASNATAGTAEPSGNTKADGFENEYDTKNITVSKTVSGNQASKDKYFAFTVNIAGATAGDKYVVSYADDNNASTADGNADTSISANPNAATTVINEDVTQPADLTVGNDGTVSQVFYLQDGQRIVIRGLGKGVTYTVTENKEDYTPSVSVTGDADAADVDNTSGGTFGKTGTVDDDITAAFTNTKEGVIPTGVLLTIAPFAIGILLFGALIIFFIAKRRRNNY